MMTAKEYVEGKVKSYTRLAERCRREAEASDDIVVRAGYSARANVWEMCAEEMDNVREMLQEEPDYRQHRRDARAPHATAKAVSKRFWPHKRKSSPLVLAHRQAARVDGFYRSHQSEDNTFSEVLQDGKKLC